MTASVGREVDANLLRTAAPGSAQSRTEPQNPGGQDLGDLVEAFGGRHEVGAEGIALHTTNPRRIVAHTGYLPADRAECRGHAQ